MFSMMFLSANQTLAHGYKGNDYAIENVLAAATISNFSPTSGCANGTVMTITGTNFTGVTSVKVGGVEVASFTVDSATQITAVTATGTISGLVSVTTAEGTTSSTASFTTTSPSSIILNHSEAAICPNSVLELTASGGTTGNGTVTTATVLTQGFEGGAAAGWTIENTSGSTAADWAYRATSHTGGSNPHTGTHLASFDGRAFAAKSGKLITPSMDLSTYTTEAKVDFWYKQPAWDADQNVLKVYYRTSATGAWTMIWSDVTSKSVWTAASIILPSVNATYQIAFEGTSAYGYSIVLDDVIVTGIANSQAAPEFTWAPYQGLFTDAAATVAYTGQSLSTVYAKPTQTGFYSVSTTNSNSCSATASVQITVAEVTAPSGNATQSFTSSQTVADLDITGTGLLYYSDAAATISIPATTALINNTTYYITQTINGCESAPLAVLVEEQLAVSTFTKNSIKAYPNPVIDMLTITNNDVITDVTIYNIMGQKLTSQVINSTDAKISFSTLTTGTYLLNVNTQNGVQIVKIIK